MSNVSHIVWVPFYQPYVHGFHVITTIFLFPLFSIITMKCLCFEIRHIIVLYCTKTMVRYTYCCFHIFVCMCECAWRLCSSFYFFVYQETTHTLFIMSYRTAHRYFSICKALMVFMKDNYTIENGLKYNISCNLLKFPDVKLCCQWGKAEGDVGGKSLAFLYMVHS